VKKKVPAKAARAGVKAARAGVKPARSAAVLEALRREYPAPKCALVHRSAYELLVATTLSAQCTDERVNQVTPALFRRFPEARTLARARPETVIDLIRSTGFYNNKTKSLLGAAQRLVDAYGGEVPSTMEDLLTLPGVARKTANVVLGTWFGKNEGVVVDTHVQRLAHRIGLTRETDPARIERDLMALFPREEWTDLSHRLILHGRRVCRAPIPRCAVCVLGPDLCPSFQPDPEVWKKRRSARPVRAVRSRKPVRT
jgi:endonuclease-3